MSSLMEQAIVKARQLPEKDQDAIASIILREIESDCRWDHFQDSSLVGAGNWQTRNQRRLALIGASLTEKLTPEEERELQELQAELDRRLEARDDQLLDQLRRMKKAAKCLPDAP